MFYASLSLSAILSLILFMGTRVSVLVPPIPVGAFLAVTWFFCGAAGAALGGTAEGVFSAGGGYAGVGVATGAAFGTSAAAAFGGAGGACGAADPALASVSSSKKSAPTSTVSPSAAKYVLITPLSGVTISTVILSVSILATIESASTKSPGPVQKQKNKINRAI